MNGIYEALLVPARHPGATSAFMRDHELLTIGPVVYRDKKDVLHRGEVFQLPCEPFSDCATVASERCEVLAVPRSGLYLDLAHRPSLDHVLYRASLKLMKDTGQIHEGDTLESASMLTFADAVQVDVTVSMWCPATPGHPEARVGREIRNLWRWPIPRATPCVVLPGGGSLVQAMGVVALAREVFSVKG